MENKEIETIIQETETEIENGNLPDTDYDGESVVEDGAADPVPEQGEETGSTTPSATEEQEERTFTEEELEQILTSVFEGEREAEAVEVVEEAPATLFNTPLEEFSVSEGLLLCILLVLIANFINSIFKGSHWFGKLRG